MRSLKIADGGISRLRRLLLILLTLVACVGCDQATKSAAKNLLSRGEVVSLFGDTVRLVYAENPGAFLSLGASLPEQVRVPLFTLGAAGLVTGAFIALLAMPRATPSTVFGVALIGAGGAGNLIDRIAYGGYVIDFLNVGVGPLRTGIFNVADMAILLGALLVMISATERKRKSDP